VDVGQHHGACIESYAANTPRHALLEVTVEAGSQGGFGDQLTAIGYIGPDQIQRPALWADFVRRVTHR
jgi:hypothetical protein